MAVLVAKDLDTLQAMFNLAREKTYPSVPTAVAVDLALEPHRLPPEARPAADIAEFKLEALSYLALAHRNKIVTVHAQRLRSLAKTFPGETRALYALGHFQDKRDVPFLMSIAQMIEPNRYRPAIAALALMCIDEAKAAVDQLKRSADVSKKAFIEEAGRFGALCSPPR